MNHRLAVTLGTLIALSPAAPVFAQDAAKLGDLERKVDILTQEIEKLKLGEAADPIAEGSALGLGSAASKVYRARPSKVSIGGYGEMTYQNFSKRRQD
ncbi:MAG: hypothetical protein AAB262_14535, partial [Elusimicrobiota bacterium]